MRLLTSRIRRFRRVLCPGDAVDYHDIVVFTSGLTPIPFVISISSQRSPVSPGHSFPFARKNREACTAPPLTASYWLANCLTSSSHRSASNVSYFKFERKKRMNELWRTQTFLLWYTFDYLSTHTAPMWRRTTITNKKAFFPAHCAVVYIFIWLQIPAACSLLYALTAPCVDGREREAADGLEIHGHVTHLK